MFARMLAAAGLTTVLVVAAGSAQPDDAVKAKLKAKALAAAKKKFEPLKTDELFKKLDANKDSALDTDEFGKILTVEPAPKRKKDADPLDLSVVFKSLDVNGDKKLSKDEFTGVIGAIYPNGKK
jgi:hypothetical protein